MNATAKHTPGPYSLHDQGEDAVLTRYSLQRDGHVMLLFEPHVGLTARDVERVFNAHDDMLAALKLMNAEYGWEIARAAIDRAEGRSDA